MALPRLRVSGFLKKCVANRESQFLIHKFLKQLVNRMCVACVHARVYACMHVCVSACVHTHTHTHTLTHIHSRSHTHTHTHTHSHTHTHTKWGPFGEDSGVPFRSDEKWSQKLTLLGVPHDLWKQGDHAEALCGRQWLRPPHLAHLPKSESRSRKPCRRRRRSERSSEVQRWRPSGRWCPGSPSPRSSLSRSSKT